MISFVVYVGMDAANILKKKKMSRVSGLCNFGLQRWRTSISVYFTVLHNSTEKDIKLYIHTDKYKTKSRCNKFQ